MKFMRERLSDPQSRLFGLFWGLLFASCLVALISARAASSWSMKPLVAASFALHTAFGPLEPLLRGETLGQTFTVGLIAIALIGAHPIRPSRITFALACLGFLLWVGCGAITLLMLA